MAGKYDDLAAQIVELDGGKTNVKSVAHCITRVRFKLKDESLASDEKISELPNVIKVMCNVDMSYRNRSPKANSTV